MKYRNDWGFPRWRGYENNRNMQFAQKCDSHGCQETATCPAPKAPNSSERWYFCQEHAAEYNKTWDYFAGLSQEEAATRESHESRTAQGYRHAAHHRWASEGDGTRSREEMRALAVLGLDSEADMSAIRLAWRALAKETHPDVKPDDAEAAKRFQAGQLAFDILRRAAEKENDVYNSNLDS